MKKLILFLTLFTAFATMTRGQSKEETEVGNAVENLRKAMIASDQTALQNIASDGLSYGHSSGKIQNKAEFVEQIVSKQSVFVTITLTDQTIKVNHNTAIVRHKFASQTNDGGKPGSVNLGIMLVWVKEHGDWKLFGRQAYKL